MSFTYNPTTEIGQIRLDIGDTRYNDGVRPRGNNFLDEELQVFLDTEGSVPAAIARALEVLSVEYARAVDTSSGDLRQSLSQIANRYADRALRMRATTGAYAGVALLNTNWVGPYTALQPLGQHEEM